MPSDITPEVNYNDATLIPFPSRFPIKVIGLRHDQFSCQLLVAIQAYDPELSLSDITLRKSKQGNYLGATVVVNAQNKAQLDDIYLALTAHPLVKVVI